MITLDTFWMFLMFLGAAGYIPLIMKVIRKVLLKISPDKYDEDVEEFMDTTEELIDELLEVMNKSKTKNQTFAKVAEDFGKTKALELITRKLL